MIYNPRSDEEHEKYRGFYLLGHSDWGSFTFLFSQPVSALQLLDSHGSWKWVQVLFQSVSCTALLDQALM